MKILFFSCLLLIQVLHQSNESAILGVWKTQLKDANIEIYKKNDQYFGKVVWIQNSTDEDGNPLVDSNNPDNKLKSRPILGMDIITGLSYSDNEWSGGKIYDPKNGETYACKLWIEEGQLKVRGYMGWFYDTKTWKKIK